MEPVQRVYHGFLQKRGRFDAGEQETFLCPAGERAIGGMAGGQRIYLLELQNAAGYGGGTPVDGMGLLGSGQECGARMVPG